MIGECVLHSSLLPPSLVSQCSTFIRALHLLPLAFNAELGSPLIKVTASQCLDEVEEGKGGRQGGRVWRKTPQRVQNEPVKEGKASLPLRD